MLALLKCAAILEVAFSVKKGGVTQILKYVTLMTLEKHSPSEFFFTYKTGQSWRRTVKEGLQALNVTGSKLRGLQRTDGN